MIRQDKIEESKNRINTEYIQNKKYLFGATVQMFSWKSLSESELNGVWWTALIFIYAQVALR